MIKLYNQDCMEALKKMKDNQFDLAIVDPPYGIGIDGQKEVKRGKKSDRKGHTFKKWDKAIPRKEYFEELKRVSKNQIIWGANYFVEHLTQGTKGWIVWDKAQHALSMSDCELAFSSFQRATRIYKRNRVILLLEGTIHPTQKPMELYMWLLENYAKPGDTILDTHLGSGSIALACHNLGFDLTGYEIDKEYFEAAKARLEEHQKQQALF
jgi:site-specific DNA-methyltransferase (adenine-specific)